MAETSLRAFAVSQTSAPRDGAAAEPWIRLLRATPDGSFDCLTSHWPELAAFVEHELGTALHARPLPAPDASVACSVG